MLAVVCLRFTRYISTINITSVKTPNIINSIIVMCVDIYTFMCMYIYFFQFPQTGFKCRIFKGPLWEENNTFHADPNQVFALILSFLNSAVGIVYIMLQERKSGILSLTFTTGLAFSGRSNLRSRCYSMPTFKIRGTG